MPMTVAQILTAAQGLSPRERETLCTKIAKSLDAPLTVEEQAWVDVAEQRAAKMRNGKVKGIPSEEVLSKARRRLGL